MIKDKLKLSAQYPPKILLLGNGINRAYNVPSWDELLKSIKVKELTAEEKEAFNKVPYPLQPIILTGDNIDNKIKDIAPALVSFTADAEEERLLKDFAELPFDALLTTNYTYEIEKATIKDFECEAGKACKFRHKTKPDGKKYETNQLFTCFEITDNKKTLWHIHGEAGKSGTVILGHYYYGKLLAKIQPYIKTLKTRESKARISDGVIEVQSWIDYFMLCDIYMVGLGLDLSELDLWWLINCKKRQFSKTKIILYHPDITLGQRMLAESYNVEIRSDGLIDKDYKTYYRKVYNEIKNEI